MRDIENREKMEVLHFLQPFLVRSKIVFMNFSDGPTVFHFFSKIESM